MGEYWGPYDKQHDLDLTRVEEMPREQGAYDNGWQLALVWCQTHMRFEWLWVQLELFPPEIRLKFIGYVPSEEIAARPLEEFLERRARDRDQAHDR
jgi:hypothetical protein